MKTPDVNPIFELGEENPFGQYFIGQSYLKMHSIFRFSDREVVL